MKEKETRPNPPQPDFSERLYTMIFITLLRAKSSMQHSPAQKKHHESHYQTVIYHIKKPLGRNNLIAPLKGIERDEGRKEKKNNMKACIGKVEDTNPVFLTDSPLSSLILKQCGVEQILD
jgi:hypothetical protein